MTLPATSIVNSYIGTGSTNSFPFNFLVFSSSDLTVVVTDPSNNQTVLTLGTDYTVAGLNPSGGAASTGSIGLVNSGQAWLTSGFLTSGWTITITRIVSVGQFSSIRNQGDFYQEFLENALDYVVMICQQLQLQQTTPVIPISIIVVAGDLTLGTAGSGIIFKTPDGTKTFKLSADNNGNQQWTELT